MCFLWVDDWFEVVIVFMFILNKLVTKNHCLGILWCRVSSVNEYLLNI